MDDIAKDLASLTTRIAVAEVQHRALEKSVADQIVALRERTALALEAQRLASDELGVSQEKRLDTLNEFRGSINKIIDSLVTTVQFRAVLDTMQAKVSGDINVVRAELQGDIVRFQNDIAELKHLRAKLEGSASQESLDKTRTLMWIGIVISASGWLVSAITVVLRITGR